jgi:hypothetical protein
MRALLFTTIVLAGCTKQNPDFCPANPDDPRCGGMGSDGGMMIDGDSTTTTTDAIVCFGTGNYRACFNEPTTPVSFGEGAAIDTANDPACMKMQPMGWTEAGQPAACFIVGTTINIPNVSVAGDRPLVLIATGNLNVNGILDAASHNGASAALPAKIGPSAPSTACMATAEPGDYDPQASKDAGGGGAGGSFFNLPGKPGGIGDTSTAAGGVAAASLTTAPVLLRAGCNAQSGGEGSAAGTAGKSGAGGGAVYLLAGGTMAFAATGGVNASGAGAGVAGARGGGGGGGSGGMIVLHAESFTATMGAFLMANGGGGGPGANNGGAVAGADPSPTMPLAVAPATNGCGNGCGNGGQGAAQGIPAGSGQDGGDNLGGGGGGGGLGYVRVNKLLPATVATSPTPDTI